MGRIVTARIQPIVVGKTVDIQERCINVGRHFGYCYSGKRNHQLSIGTKKYVSRRMERYNESDGKHPEYLLRILDSYLDDRVLTNESENGDCDYQISSVVPQGSVLGPLLWNIMYCVVFSEFSGILIAGHIAFTIDEMELIVNEPIAKVNG